MILSNPGNASIGSRNFTVSLRGVTIGASGSPADRANTIVPSGVTRWIPTAVRIRAASATGTLTTAVVGVYTQAAAAGTTIVTAAALTGVSAANKIITSTVASVTDGITDTGIFVRQTLDSLNAGTIDVFIDCIDLT